MAIYGWRVWSGSVPFYRADDVDAATEDEARALVEAQHDSYAAADQQAGPSGGPDALSDDDAAYEIYRVEKLDAPTGHTVPHFSGHAGGNG